MLQSINTISKRWSSSSEGFAAMGCDDHLAPELAEHALGHQLVDRVVLHQQDARAVRKRCGFYLDRVEHQLRVAAQVALQDLVQRVTAQRAGLLLQRRQGRDFFAGQKLP